MYSWYVPLRSAQSNELATFMLTIPELRLGEGYWNYISHTDREYIYRRGATWLQVACGSLSIAVTFLTFVPTRWGVTYLIENFRRMNWVAQYILFLSQWQPDFGKCTLGLTFCDKRKFSTIRRRLVCI